MNRLLILAIIVLAFIGGYWIWFGRAKPAEVRLVSAERTEMSLSFTAEAFVVGKTYDLAPEIPGRINSVLIKESDSVSKGQLLLTIDDTELRSQLNRASAARSTAMSAVSEANSAFLSTQETFRSLRAKANAGIAKAEAEFKRVSRGSRTEAINQAQHELNRLRKIEGEMKLRFDRAERLYAEGAIAMVERDTARLNYENAKEQSEIAEDFLLELRNGPVSEELESAKASLEIARADLRVANAMQHDVNTRRAQVSAARYRLKEAESEIQRVRALLEKSFLRSPVDGIVFRCNAEVGTIGNPASTVIRLSTRTDLHVEAEIRSEDIEAVKVGSEVEILLPSQTGKTFKGRIERISPVAESKPEAAIRTRIVRVRIQILESPENFVPGLEVDIRGGEKQKAILSVPNGSIKIMDEFSVVYVVSNGVVEVRKVLIGRSESERTEILSGLQAGEMVIVGDAENLRDGQIVRQANEQD